jgi:tetratricopeptide (TPR) repeat protein
MRWAAATAATEAVARMGRRSGSGMRWRASREQSWWLFAAAAVLAIAGVVLARWKGPSWILLGLAAGSAVGGLLLTRLQGAAKREDERAAVLAGSTRTVDESGRQERVGDVDLRRFGVHRAHIDLGYIHRDAEAELLPLLNAAAPVLVVGHSLAGKTRMTAQVLREHFADRPILLPSPPDGLAELAAQGAQPHGTVVWLDDLDRYLPGAGMRVEWLDRMRQRGNLLVATMRASEHARYQPDSQVRPPQAELLERFEVLRLQPDDARERERLAGQVKDPGLREGIARYGLAEYVGGGYLAVQRFENARAAPHPQGHPLGVAMVRAAVDWHRVGLDVIPATSLAALAPMYLPERYRYDPGEDTTTARAWATELVDGTMRLLEPADDHDGVRAFDYVLDYLTTPSSDGPGNVAGVPEHTWREAVAVAPVERRMDLAYNAYDSAQPGHAEDLWRQVAADPDRPEEAPEAAFNLGFLLAEQGRPEEAAAAYRQAIDSGHADAAPKAAVNLGDLLAEQGRPEEAAAPYGQVVDPGHADGSGHAPR